MRFLKSLFLALAFLVMPTLAFAMPTYSDLTVASSNVDTEWATTGDMLTFDLELTDGRKSSAGSQVTFSIGATTGLIATFPVVGVQQTNHLAPYTVLAGQTGAISVTNIEFFGGGGNSMVGHPAFPYTPTPNVNVDTTAPVFDSLTADGRDVTNTSKALVGTTQYLTVGERIFFTAKIDPSDTMSDINTVDFTLGGGARTTNPFLGTAGTAKAKTRNRNYFVQPGENGAIVLTALNFTDRAGNSITGTVLPDPTNIVVDTELPAVHSVTHTSSNTVGPRFAKEGDTVTYEIIFSERVHSVTLNTPSSAASLSSGPTVDLAGTPFNTGYITFPVVAGDNGEVIPTVDFDITDRAGNMSNITDLAPILGGGFDGKIFADTTAPTLDVVSITSDNLNSSEWAKTGDTITVSIQASEKLKTSLVTATIAGKAATVTKTCGDPNCDTYDLSITVDGTETEGVATLAIDFQDRAGNPGVQATATTDASVVMIDYTAPTVPDVAIASNNALDTTLAKTNDTVTVTFEIADNLSTLASLVTMPAAMILDAAITASNATMVAAGQTIERFTDGSEDSEVVVPFKFQVADIAGNESALVTATTDGSEVKFDRTDPVIRNVKISAISQDGSAYQGDVPTYYAKQGDKIRLKLQVCDYVDSNNNPPTGTLFGQAITLNDKGLVGAPGNCTTGDGNPSQWRKWQKTIQNVDGTEGFVDFIVVVKDNAGNQIMNVSGTTDGSSVIFDKTNPTTPTDVMDLGGVATPNYKPFEQADYTWSDEEDPMGGNPVSGLYQNDLRFFNPNTGINEMVTLDYLPVPVQAFTPANVIPDVDPYIVFMDISDKAGNASGETNTYEQRYGITLDGKILDNEADPVNGGIVQIIAASGETCDGVASTCATTTNAQGEYLIVVAPNQDYIVNFYGSHFLKLEKQELAVGTDNITKVVPLALVEGNNVQTLDSGIVIITDKTFDDNGVTTPTQITVGTESGTVSTEKIDQNTFRITSFGNIPFYYSNDPDVLITRVGPNELIVVNGGQVASIVDKATQSASATGGPIGLKPIVGNGSSGSYSGMLRSERLVHGDANTYEESLAFAQKMNEGTPQKTHFYVNSNGHIVFMGYQKGRMALEDFDHRMENYVVFRGDKTGGDLFTEFLEEDLDPQQARLKAQFQTAHEENNYRERLNGVANKNRYASLQTLSEEDRGPLAGYGKKFDIYQGINNRNAYNDRHVNKFAKGPRDTSSLAASRMRQSNPYNVVLRHNGQTVTLGRIIDKERTGPQVVQRDQAVILGQ